MDEKEQIKMEYILDDVRDELRILAYEEHIREQKEQARLDFYIDEYDEDFDEEEYFEC